MRRALTVIVAALITITGFVLVAPEFAVGAADDHSGQGVTPTSIKLGITYLDAAAVRNIVNLDPGNFQVAYTALIDQINAKGGINGRKIVPVFEPIDPIGTAPAAKACTALTEDDKVFAVIGFFQAADTACYVATHDTPMIGATLTDAESAQAKAPWFNNVHLRQRPHPQGDDGVQEGRCLHQDEGRGGGRHVRSGRGEPRATRAQEAQGERGTDRHQQCPGQRPGGDEFGVRHYRPEVQGMGANVVIAVGDAGVSWPKALHDNQSTYLPRLIVPDSADLATVLSNKANYSAAELRGALTAGGTPSPAVEWNDPAMKRCVATVHAAEPNAVINNPVTATASTPVTWSAPENACQELALFEDIAKAAGKTLNNATFNRGGESLTHLTIPGGGGIYDFGPGHRDGDGPVTIFEWNAAAKKLVAKATVG